MPLIILFLILQYIAFYICFRNCPKDCPGCHKSIGIPVKLEKCAHFLCVNCTKSLLMCPVCGADHDRDYVYSIEQDQSIKYVLNFRKQFNTNMLKILIAATLLQFCVKWNC